MHICTDFCAYKNMFLLFNVKNLHEIFLQTFCFFVLCFALMPIEKGYERQGVNLLYSQAIF